MQITDNIREKLTPYLQKGWRKDIAEKAGVHKNTVTNVFNNHSRNDYVAQAILTYVEEIKARQQQLEERAGKIDDNHTGKIDTQEGPDNS